MTTLDRIFYLAKPLWILSSDHPGMLQVPRQIPGCEKRYAVSPAVPLPQRSDQVLKLQLSFDQSITLVLLEQHRHISLELTSVFVDPHVIFVATHKPNKFINAVLVTAMP